MTDEPTSDRLIGHRYLLVYLDADSTGDGYGKNADVTLYPLDDLEQGERLAGFLEERESARAQDWGGYPGKAWVIDLQKLDPAMINDLEVDYAEWEEEIKANSDDNETPTD